MIPGRPRFSLHGSGAVLGAVCVVFASGSVIRLRERGLNIPRIVTTVSPPPPQRLASLAGSQPLERNVS